jgi:predicted nucleic acid-binding protein
LQPSQRPFFIDSNIFNKIVNEPGAFALVTRLVRRGAIELLVTHVQIDQIAATRDEERRKKLLRVVPLCREVPTHGLIYGVSKYGKARYTSEPVSRDVAAIQRRNKAKDALIGATAKWDGATLVTEDRKFHEDASGLGIAVLWWSEFIAHLRAIHV